VTVRIITHPREMTQFSDAARARGEKIALVPTMGCLHEGHLSLMREGRRRAGILVASIFVNPTQFGPREDFARYPRDLQHDCRMMETIPVDAAFVPAASDIYAPGAETWVEVTELSRGLCGRSRPGHFRGVTTVVAKLFNIVRPHLALFGQKDFQQLRAIQRMVLDLHFGVEIVPVPIVREADGLAMSSRNAYLSAEERRQALSLSRALSAARKKYLSDGRTPAEVAGAAAAVLRDSPAVAVEYVEAVDAETLEPAASLDRPLLIAIAARVGATRLIDNAVLWPGDAQADHQEG
jgi:pantoate--beta-alanine ligase